MRAISKVLAASAVALSLGAFASPASALTQFASAAADGAPALSFTSGGGAGGTIASTGQAWFFAETLAGVTGLNPMLASFSLSATSASGTYGCYSMAVCGVAGFDGTLTYTYDGPDKNYSWYGSSRTLHTGDILLQATFTNAWIQGTGTSGSFDVTTVSPYVTGTVTNIASDLYSFGSTNDFDFAYTLTGANIGNPAVGTTYASFSSGSSASFSAGVVPEPGTWALMILGFGGAGAMLRSRRQLSAVA
jgi:hypothetical protein